MKYLKVFAGAVLAFIFLSSFYQNNDLKGTWQYAGDIFKGVKEGAPTGYSLQRKYDDTGFRAFVIEKGYEPEKYETGNYTISGDTCLETQTWCSQPSGALNITVHYHYSIINDTLTLKGVLPNGERVEEYWKRLK